jgi:dipeptidyl aminopeptidase/acylaminoacyl peptidase
MTLFNLRLRFRLLLATLGVASSVAFAQQPFPSSIQSDGLALPEQEVQTSLPRYLQSRAARFVDWLSDGSMLIATRFGDTEQIHRLRAPLGMREQMSFAPEGIAAAQARPYANDSFVYLEPVHGGESSRLYLQHFATHELTALTDGNHRDAMPLWAHDGRHLALASNRVNGVDLEIYELDSENPAAVPRLLAGGAGQRWRIFDWSLDDKRLLLGRSASAAAALSDPQLFIVDVGDGEIAAVNAGSVGSGKNATSTPVHARDARFAPDGHGVVLLTDQVPPGSAADSNRGKFHHLVYLDPHGSGWRDLTPNAAHDVERFDVSSDGHYIAYTLNENGVDRLMLLDQTRRLDLGVTQVPLGVINSLKFDSGNQRLALSMESTRAPGDVYVYEPESHLLTEWTHSEVGPVNADGFVLPTTLKFATWDRLNDQPRELSALVYRAALSGAEAPRPVVILLCSGGGTQCRPGFDPYLQFLINELKFVVLAPNVRGASGQGSNLEQAGAGELRDDAVRDVGSLLVWIGLQPSLDRNRVALLGEGFGAWLTLQSLAAYGDRLRGGIAAFAPHGATLGHAAEIRRPLLLVQGLNNPSAPSYELDGLRARLRSEGSEVQSLAASGEGERFVRKADRDAYLAAAASFLVQLLR